VKRVEVSTELVQILNDLEADPFDGITAGDESWFQYLYESLTMFVRPPRDVILRTRKQIGVKQTMFTIFLTNRKLLIAEYLPKGQKYSQDCFISDVLPGLEREKMRYKWRKQGGTFCVQMDHSKSHDHRKVQEKFDTKSPVCSHHPPYSPDLSPCDFWFFGMVKGKMRDRECHTIQDILGCLTEI
jgi:histone-lysine N-methyltransferase SETMAR